MDRRRVSLSPGMGGQAMTRNHSGRDGRGIQLAERLGLSIKKREGHDLVGPCIACASSDAFRLHVDTGVGHCFSCEGGWSPFDVAKTVLKDVDTSKSLMIELGIFEPLQNGKQSRDGRRKPRMVADPIDEIARMKCVSRQSLVIYGAKKHSAKEIHVPVYGADGTPISYFRLVTSLGHKGKFPRGGQAGLFLPHVDGKVRLPKPGETWIVVEGVKDAAALHDLGQLAVGLPSSAMNGRFARLFAGVNIIVIPDRDTAGENGASKSGSFLYGVASTVSVATLPAEFKKSKGEDVRDVLKREDGRRLVLQAIADAQPWQPGANLGGNSVDGKELPQVVLPGGPQRVIDSAHDIGTLLAATESYFYRGGCITRLAYDDDGARRLQPLKPASMPAVFELVANLAKVMMKDGEPIYIPTTCNEQTAKILLHSEPFQVALPPINVLTRCAVLLERDGALVQISGYDRQSGILTDGGAVPDVSLIQARRLLADLLHDFRFATEGDRSRALAALITPALVLGGLLRGRAPLDLSEADQSQAGKGFRNKLTAAIYREIIKSVTQRRGGVGSLEETFGAALISGAPFISLDNVRGKIDSPAIESFLTEDRFLARVPFIAPVEIDPGRTVVMVTSNKAELTPDLANRSSCVRILKQPPGYAFRTFGEGDLLDHVKANQPQFLGAIFSVVRAWFDAGKPTTKEDRHDFRRWARVLDWIVQELLEAAPIMEGHRQTQQRMANPGLTWLREVALVVVHSKRNDGWLRTHHILDLLENAGLEIPGAEDGVDLEDQATRDKALRGIGKRLASCFGPNEAKLEIDHLVIERRETVDESGRDRKEYLFQANQSGKNVEVPAFPHTPHEPPTLSTSASICAPNAEDAHIRHEEEKVRSARGKCGGMRECGEDLDDVNDLLAEAAVSDEPGVDDEATDWEFGPG
jgi:hypothetical protein